MTSEEKKKIRQFEARVRQLILQYQTLQNEIAGLNGTLKHKDEEISDLTTQLKSYKQKYNDLKVARMIEISDGDIKYAKQHLTGLVREINKCIGLLNKEDVIVENED